MPLSNRRLWSTWALIALIHFYQGCILAFPTVMTAEINQLAQGQPINLGLLFSVYLISTIAVQIPGGLILDTIGNRKTMVLLLLLIISGTLVYAVASTFAEIILGTLLLGVGAGMSYITVIHFSKEWLPPPQFSRSLYYISIIGSTGFVGCSLILSVINKFQTLSDIAFELAAIGSILLTLIVIFYPYNTIKETKNAYLFEITQLKSILIDKKIWLIGIYAGGVFCQYTVLSNMWRVSYFTSVLKISEFNAALYNNLSLIGFFIGCYVCSFLCNYVKPLKIMLVAAIIQLVILNIIYLLPMDFWRWSLLFALGAICAPTIYSYDLLKSWCPDNNYGVASGFLTMLDYSFGSLIGYLFGLLPHHVSTTHLASEGIFLLSLANIFGIVALLGYLKFAKTKSQSVFS